MTTKDEVRSTVEALIIALEALKLKLAAPEPTTKQKVDAAVEQYAKTGNGRVLEVALGNIIINETLDKMAKNARELGLDYEPAQKDYKAFYDGKKWCSVEVEQPAPVAQVRSTEKPHEQQDHDCALKRGGIVCRHCDLEIVEASYDPQIARQQDIPDLIAGALGVSRGTAYDMMREALVVAQQQSAERGEPVAYMNPDDLEKMKRIGRGSVAWATPTDFCTQPVYTSPPASKPWVGLTEYERADVYKAIPAKEFCVDAVGIAIEAELREKNAQPSKPWVHATTWSGLTQAELNMIGDMVRTWNSHSIVDVYTAIEAKLKEKNGF